VSSLHRDATLPGPPAQRSLALHAVRAAMAAGLIVWAVAGVLAQQPPQTTPAAPAQPKPSSAMASWYKALAARVARFQRYPTQARGAEGVVTVGFRIDRQGQIVSSQIVKSSGSAVLDADALALIKRAAPLPAPPAEIADANLSFVVPIRYRVS
jgi:periplasmic protein TonB